MSERLSAIAESLPSGGVVCDVGSDHGALPLFLIQEGKIRHAIVTDLNAPPLARAKAAFQKAGLEHKADFYLTDGMEEVLPHGADSYVIAGMGGETIAGILSRALDRIPKGTFFALQPMTKSEALRCYLCENGFLLEDEIAISENNKCFLIFLARFDGKKKSLGEKEAFLGCILPTKKDACTRDYFERLFKQTEQKCAGKKKAGLSTAEETKRIDWIRSVLENMDEDS